MGLSEIRKRRATSASAQGSRKRIRQEAVTRPNLHKFCDLEGCVNYDKRIDGTVNQSLDFLFVMNHDDIFFDRHIEKVLDGAYDDESLRKAIHDPIKHLEQHVKQKWEEPHDLDRQVEVNNHLSIAWIQKLLREMLRCMESQWDLQDIAGLRLFEVYDSQKEYRVELNVVPVHGSDVEEAEKEKKPLEDTIHKVQSITDSTLQESAENRLSIIAENGKDDGIENMDDSGVVLEETTASPAILAETTTLDNETTDTDEISWYTTGDEDTMSDEAYEEAYFSGSNPPPHRTEIRRFPQVQHPYTVLMFILPVRRPRCDNSLDWIQNVAGMKSIDWYWGRTYIVRFATSGFARRAVGQVVEYEFREVKLQEFVPMATPYYLCKGIPSDVSMAEAKLRISALFRDPRVPLSWANWNGSAAPTRLGTLLAVFTDDIDAERFTCIIPRQPGHGLRWDATFQAYVDYGKGNYCRACRAKNHDLLRCPALESINQPRK